MPHPAGSTSAPFSPHDARYEMEMAFSRGLHTGWFRGTNNQALVHAKFGKKRGFFLGVVLEVQREGVLVQLEGPLKRGDGVVFDAGTPEQKEEGGRVYQIKSNALSSLATNLTSGTASFMIVLPMAILKAML